MAADTAVTTAEVIVVEEVVDSVVEVDIKAEIEVAAAAAEVVEMEIGVALIQVVGI